MKFITNTPHPIRLACIAGLLAIHAWPAPQQRNRYAQPVINRTLAGSTDSKRSRFDPDGSSINRTRELYRALPLAFEANCGQVDPQIKYLSRSAAGDLYLTENEAVIALRPADRSSKKSATPNPGNAGLQPCTIRMKLTGASGRRRLIASTELPGKVSYFIGNDPKKWRTNVPTYSRVKSQGVYPGVDVVFYGKDRQLEYDFIVAPGANVKSINLAFEGAQRIQIDDSGDLLIETPAGQVRQRKPATYQESAGVRHDVEAGYIIRGEGEVGFEVAGYDPTRTLVIDPVFVYSTSIGGASNDSANAVALDSDGNAYITGMTTSIDFPAVNAFQPGLKIGPSPGVPSDAFVTKLNASGTAIVYSTYLGGSSGDVGNGIAVDSAGNAYVTGFASSSDFPTTVGAFQTKPSTGGDAFITKLNASGNGLSYSTLLGGPNTNGFTTANVGRGIAVDRDGNAYVAGYTFSATFPLKKPAQSMFNMGVEFGFDCLRFSLIPVSEDAFITKLNPSGAALVYSTYLGGRGSDEAYAIAVDSNGSAYVTGTTCSFDFPTSTPTNDNNVSAFVVKLSGSGKQFAYGIRFGGRGNDIGYGVAVDFEGSAYVTGQTDSDDFPTTGSAFQPRLGGSVLYATTDGGSSWRAVSGFSNSSATVVDVDPTNPLRLFAGVVGRTAAPGLLQSIDGGMSWGPTRSLYPNNYAWSIAVDPKNPAVIYTDLYRSTNDGESWTLMRFPSGGPFGPSRIIIDPINSSTVYLLALGGISGDVIFPPRFFKTTDAGSTWDIIRNGTSPFGPTAAVLDPKNPSTLYVVRSDLFKSTDGGNTWRTTHEGFRNFSRLAIDPINTSTLYLSEPSGTLFKTTDSGATFTKLVGLGFPVSDLQVDPIDTATVYAAGGNVGRGGAVIKTTDGGLTWNATDLIAASVNSLAIDPSNSQRLFAAVDFDVDSFVVKINSPGSALAYSTYLGTRSPDITAGIGVDAVGNAYVTGKTFSDRFPRKDELQTVKPSGLLDTALFATKLNATASSLIFSTYAGGSEPSLGSGIAVDAAGKVCLVGTTGIFQPVPADPSIESVHGGFDALVIKIVSPPRIAGVTVSGKNLIVAGEGFDRGAVILIDGVEQRTRNEEANPATILIGKKAAKNIAPGQQVSLQVRNADGLRSETFSFVRLN